MQKRLANLLGAVALAVDDRMRRALVEGVVSSGAQPAALVHLAAYPGGSVEGLSRVLGVSQPRAVQVVNGLVAAGLAERQAGRDRRTIALRLTRAGSREAERLLHRRSGAIAEILTGLGEGDQRRLLPLLEKLVAHLADDRPTALAVCRLCDRDACATAPGCPLDHTVAAGGHDDARAL